MLATPKWLALLTLTLTACTGSAVQRAEPSPSTMHDDALRTAANSYPIATTTAAATATVITAPPCRSSALQAVAAWQGAGGTMAGTAVVTNVGPTRCHLRGRPGITILADTMPLAVTVHEFHFDPGHPDDVGPGVALAQGQGAGAFFVWSNWCASKVEGTLTLLLTLPETAEQLPAAHVPLIGGYPRCDEPPGESAISIDVFRMRPK